MTSLPTMLRIRNAPTSSLFAGSRPVAPAYSIKPGLPPPSGGSRYGGDLQQHNNFVPTFIPNNTTNSNIPLSVPPEDLDSSDILCSGTRVPLVSHDLDSDDNYDHEAFDTVLHDLAQMEHLWDHSLHSADDGSPPPVCDCHAVFKGSCPDFKNKFIDQIIRCRQFPGPNMDGAKIPLLEPFFNADVWEAALGAYFDAKELVAALRFGWDMDLQKPTVPKDARRNNVSAVQFPEHVVHYLESELAYGSIVGPFRPGALPFDVF